MSALMAALPILTILVMLGVLRRPAWLSALTALAVALLVALFGYGMPAPLALSATAYGAAFGLFPIWWVVFTAILLYQIVCEAGQFEVIKRSIVSLTSDRRLQVLLIAFAFGSFMEGAAGFGAPVAVAASMLAGIGFSQVQGATLCLIANTSPVAFGSIGIPLITLALTTGLPLAQLSGDAGRLCAPMSLVLPSYLVVVLGGWRAWRGVWPAAALAGVVYAATQYLVSTRVGPQLTDILGSLVAISALLLLLRSWRPRDTADYQLVPEPAADGGPAGAAVARGGTRPLSGAGAGAVVASPARAAAFANGSSTAVAAQPSAVAAASAPAAAGLAPLTARQVLRAWSPYLLLVVLVILWGVDVKKWLGAGTTALLNWPGLHNLITRVSPVVAKPSPYAAVYRFDWVTAAGTAVFLSAVLSALLLRLSPRRFGTAFGTALRQLALPALTFGSVLGLAFLMNYSGATATLGLAFAATGKLFPFFSAVLGWVGVFLTGSDTSANALFGNLQVITARQLHLDPVLMAASNSAGGVMGKMISLQSIAVAAAATGLSARAEPQLFRRVILHSLFLTTVVALLNVVYAYVGKPNF